MSEGADHKLKGHSCTPRTQVKRQISCASVILALYSEMGGTDRRMAQKPKAQLAWSTQQHSSRYKRDPASVRGKVGAGS